jgi:hypothetical protein
MTSIDDVPPHADADRTRPAPSSSSAIVIKTSSLDISFDIAPAL